MYTTTQKENQPAGNATPATVSPIRLQPKLSIGAVNDPLEHEADAMADKVMSMQDVPAVAVTAAGGIQRKCAHCEEEEKVQRKPLASFIQRKESSAGTVASDAVSNKINASKGNGSSMDSHTQSFMQSRFGTDFSDVKVHTGGEAIQMNRELNAKAFTIGNDIYFNEGQYNPNSGDGKHLLAHELVHTIQQGQHNSGVENLAEPVIQRKWTLDRMEYGTGTEIKMTEENGRATAVSYPNGTTSAVGSDATTWQEQGLVKQKVGGKAQTAHWRTHHFIFKNDGKDADFLELKAVGQYAGNAKAEDLYYARAASVVWGRIIERTAANPTPPGKDLFEIKNGAVSAATIGDLGVIEIEHPVGDGNVKVTIPLKKVSEGTLMPYSGSIQKIYDASNSIDEVDVFMGARVEADAEIRDDWWGITPWISRNYNYSEALGAFGLLNWESRPAPVARIVPAPTAADDVTAQKSKLSYPADCKRGTLMGAASKGGCSTREGGSHTVVYKNDKQVTTIPRSIKENGTCRSIIKALNENCLS